MQITRRSFTAGAAAASALALTQPGDLFAEPDGEQIKMNTQSKTGGFWPNGAKLAVSVSLMFEGGGQPVSGSGGPIPEPIKNGLPDLPTNAFFAYGHYEGIPRALNLFDKHNIKVSSFMIGKAVQNAPELAQEIVRRGHEAAAHGRTWQNSYFLPQDEEKRFIADSRTSSRR
jgi:peptidoglycan/xylan/chitin deacetylase (PgdA/CDA1 family)